MGVPNQQEAAGNIVFFDRGNARVQVFRLSDGSCIRAIGSSGNGNGQLGSRYNCGDAFDS